MGPVGESVPGSECSLVTDGKLEIFPGMRLTTHPDQPFPFSWVKQINEDAP